MKVKLLKKVRKRYSITHYPNGIYLSALFYDGPITVLWDNENELRYQIESSKFKESAYDKLYQKLLVWIEKDYGPSSSKRKRLTSEQLWYKK